MCLSYTNALKSGGTYNAHKNNFSSAILFNFFFAYIYSHPLFSPDTINSNEKSFLTLTKAPPLSLVLILAV